MSGALELTRCAALVTVQDGGRPGHLARGLARGGAADRQALAEASALLRVGCTLSALEIAAGPVTLRADRDVVLALTGAPMAAATDGRALAWHAAHSIPAGTELSLIPGGQGTYSYVTPDGGLATPELLGSRAAHRIAGIGAALSTGDRLPLGEPRAVAPARLSRPEDRFAGGVLRCVPTPQTALFPRAELARFQAAAFRRDPRGNRQGVRLTLDGPGFATEGQLALLSDFVLPGDVQTTGDGVPYVLGPECQTTGGYPRIAHVIAADLPRAMQAPPGAALRFEMIEIAAARAVRPTVPAIVPLVRDPRDIPDLGGYQLIDGVVDGTEGR